MRIFFVIGVCCIAVFCAVVRAEVSITLQPGRFSYNYEALLIVCRDKAISCTETDKGLLLYATLIPEKGKRGTQQSGIVRPDRHWIIEMAADVTFAELLKRFGDLGCGPGEEHFVHAIERQLVGLKHPDAPYEFRRMQTPTSHRAIKAVSR